MPRPASCATVFVAVMLLVAAPAVRAETSDPLEGFNRKVLAFNDTADRFVLKPVAKGYRAITPKPVRRSIGNFFANIFTPVTALNQVLQGKFRQGGQDTLRFLVNTTLGVGGLFDVSSKVGLPQHDEDFDQTFARWGIGSGPFLMLPFAGPSTVRGGVGSICGAAVNPIRYLDDPSWRYGLSGLYFVDTRTQLLDVEQLVGGDRYVFLRDAYLQRRAFLINDGALTEDPFLEDFDDEGEGFDDTDEPQDGSSSSVEAPPQ